LDYYILKQDNPHNLYPKQNIDKIKEYFTGIDKDIYNLNPKAKVKVDKFDPSNFKNKGEGSGKSHLLNKLRSGEKKSESRKASFRKSESRNRKETNAFEIRDEDEPKRKYSYPSKQDRFGENSQSP